MDWGKGASGQPTLSPQPYPILWSHPLSGKQVRGGQTQAPDLPKLDPRSLPRARSQMDSIGLKYQPSMSPSAPLMAGQRYGSAIIPEELGAENGVFRAILVLAQKVQY